MIGVFILLLVLGASGTLAFGVMSLVVWFEDPLRYANRYSDTEELKNKRLEFLKRSTLMLKISAAVFIPALLTVSLWPTVPNEEKCPPQIECPEFVCKSNELKVKIKKDDGNW